MKYKLLKTTPWIAENAIIEINDGDISIENDRFIEHHKWEYASETYEWIDFMIRNHPEDFEKIEETTKPKWKVGDYVVFEWSYWAKKYIKLFEVQKSSEFEYNRCFSESDLRDPTEEELSLYFR